MLKLRPKNIIIVGGASGIGYATAELMLKQGATKVILASRNQNKLDKAVRQLNAIKKENQGVYSLDFDITDIGSHQRFIDNVNELIGDRADGLVISSGVNYNAANWRGFNITEADYDLVMNTNLKGVFFLMRNFSNYATSNNILVNICIVSSISAHRDLLSVYQVSKNAISGIVHAYGKHLYKKGVILNAVEPGGVSTDMRSKDITDGVRPGQPWTDCAIGRFMRPEEIAESICFLMSDIGETMCGTCLLVSGGTKGLCR